MALLENFTYAEKDITRKCG